jgi:hypothetical protein
MSFHSKMGYFFLPYCRATLQGICEKYGKYRVIFNSSMQTGSDEVVLNQVTSKDLEAPINFGRAKTTYSSISIIGE